MNLFNWWTELSSFGLIIICFFVIIGLYLGFRLRFVPFRLGRSRISATDIKERGAAPFQVFLTVLAGTVSPINILGVCTALYLGGPGALFWMWVAAGLGMIIIFASTLLSVKYRDIRDNQWVGGLMYSIKNGLKERYRVLGFFFAVVVVVMSFIIGAIVCSTTIAWVIKDGFRVPGWVSGFIFTSLLALVVIGGVKRIIYIGARLFIFMICFYFIGVLGVVFSFWSRVLEVIFQIFSQAFQGGAPIGGILGTVFIATLKSGAVLGIFSSEVGMGTGPIFHAITCIKDPFRQAHLAKIAPLVDTIISTFAGFVILLTGVLGEKGKDTIFLKQALFFRRPVVSLAESRQKERLFSGVIKIEKGRPIHSVFMLARGGPIDDPVIYLEKTYFSGILRIKNGKVIQIATYNKDGILELRPKEIKNRLKVQAKMLLSGLSLITLGFERGILKGLGKPFVIIVIVLFGFSTAFVWAYYGERGIEFLLGSKANLAYRLGYITCYFLGALFCFSFLLKPIGFISLFMWFLNLICILILILRNSKIP